MKIQTISSAGGEPEPVMELDSTRVAGVAVSADGKKLAAVVRGPDNVWSVSISDPISAPLKPYSPAPFAAKELFNGSSLAFSPDGSKLLFSHTAEKEAEPWILPLPVGSQAPRRLFEQVHFGQRPAEFSWMPDNRHVVLAFNADSDAPPHLWYADTESASLVQLTASPTGESSPEVSPDGRGLLFSQEQSSADIISMSLVDGSTQTLVKTGWKEALGSWARNAPLFSHTSDRNGEMEIWLRTQDGQRGQS